MYRTVETDRLRPFNATLFIRVYPCSVSRPQPGEIGVTASSARPCEWRFIPVMRTGGGGGVGFKGAQRGKTDRFRLGLVGGRLLLLFTGRLASAL